MRHIILTIIVFVCVQTHAMAPKISIEKAIDNAIARYGLRMEPQMISLFNKAGVAYPPHEIALLAFKKERHIQLWARDEGKPWEYINAYPLTAFSGRLGPKLKEYDRQIPEGVYRLTSFNPFSSMHLSIMLDYPNHFDRLQASKDGRKKLGGDIFLHGKTFSVGCLAIGDKGIDQLFLLARRVGLRHVRVIIAPNDLRKEKPATTNFAQPRWLPELYKQIAHELRHFPVSRKIS